jgi:formylglycine-generating enzyme required for sulfatase activity
MNSPLSTLRRAWPGLCLALLALLPAWGAADAKAVGRVLPLSPQQRAGAELKANFSAGLFVGVGEFEEKSGLSRLSYTPDDAVALAHLFVVELGLIPPANARLALGGQPQGTNAVRLLAELRQAGVPVLPARKVEVLDALGDVARTTDDPAGLIIVALSSHGFEQNEDVFLMPADSRRAYIASTGISLKAVKQTLRESKANKRILLLDACREQPAGATKGDERMSAAFRQALKASEGFAVLLSCETGQLSWEAPEFGQGVFTHFFLQAVRGGTAGAGDGLVRLGDVSRQASEATRDWVRRNKQADQVPTLDGELARQIPLALDARVAAQQAEDAKAQRALAARRDRALNFLGEARKQHRALLSGALEDAVDQAARELQGDGLIALVEQLEELEKPSRVRAEAFVAWWKNRAGTTPAATEPPAKEPPTKEPVALVGPKPNVGGPVTTASGGPWTKERPFVNSLGMKFVPVAGSEVLFSVWETRVQDFEAFVGASGYDATAGMFSYRSDGWKKRGDTWKNPGFAQTPNHPVCGVSWEDAQKFAAWLTEKERREGQLTAQQRYRLPSDVEWSRAVGLASESGSTPEARNRGVKDVFPWGQQWPPPRGAGNYDSYSSSKLDTDNFDRTSPAGSFAANQFGLFDLGGNVWEWCEDYYYGRPGARVLRGGSWFNHDRDILLSSIRGIFVAEDRLPYVGFRLVLVGGSVR